MGIELEFSGKEDNEKGVIIDINHERLKELGISNNNLHLGTTVVKVDPKYYRPTEVDLLLGDPTKAKKQLGWTPKYDLQGLVTDMVQSDLHLVKKDKYLAEGGFKTLNYFE
ncbi:GDP-mannose 4,6-dehydratase [compost metagenome]